MIRGNQRKVRVLKNCRNILILGEELCLARGIFLTLAKGYEGGHYLAKYRPMYWAHYLRAFDREEANSFPVPRKGIESFSLCFSHID